FLFFILAMFSLTDGLEYIAGHNNTHHNRFWSMNYICSTKCQTCIKWMRPMWRLLNEK
ncbi:hypothetical protein ACJX0J_033874, partial [Zea mays]